MNPELELDHLIYGTPDLDATVADLEERFGVEFRHGGRHPGWGTHNRVIPLGGDRYLEVIGPDPSQAGLDGGPILGLDRLEAARMVWWAVRPFLMPLTCGEFETAGFIPGDVIQGSRERPDGTTLVWQLTDPRVVLADGVLPMVIDWEGAAHPGADAAGVSLAGMELHHPQGRDLTLKFVELGLPEVAPAEAPGIVAHFDTPNGRVTLR